MLTRLERLQAAQNALIGLPSSFARLQALRVLSLAKNKIVSVPDALGECGRLEELDFSDNYLQASCHSRAQWSCNLLTCKVPELVCVSCCIV